MMSETIMKGNFLKRLKAKIKSKTRNTKERTITDKMIHRSKTMRMMTTRKMGRRNHHSNRLKSN